MPSPQGTSIVRNSTGPKHKNTDDAWDVWLAAPITTDVHPHDRRDCIYLLQLPHGKDIRTLPWWVIYIYFSYL